MMVGESDHPYTLRFHVRNGTSGSLSFGLTIPTMDSLSKLCIVYFVGSTALELLTAFINLTFTTLTIQIWQHHEGFESSFRFKINHGGGRTHLQQPDHHSARESPHLIRRKINWVLTAPVCLLVL